ncbi:MAG TPA: PqqD family protein [Solirubrobacteraceae bacterium]
MARADELVIEELGDERLVYDLRVHRAHSLGATATSVWQRCDGKTSVAAIALELAVDPEVVEHALEELESCALLEEAPQLGTTRRELGIRIAKVGGAATAAPLIVSLAVPAVAAATPTVAFCTGNGTSHGCGSDCDARHCCCCCQSTTSPPVLCGGDTKCCLPTVQCEGGVFGKKANCANKAPCP